MTDNEDEEQKPTCTQLATAYLGKTLMDGGVSDGQLAAAYPEAADANGDSVWIPEDDFGSVSIRDVDYLPEGRDVMDAVFEDAG